MLVQSRLPYSAISSRAMSMAMTTQNPAVFYQIAEHPLKERKMIEKATVRELFIDELEHIINLIKLKQIEVNMKCIYDIFHLLIKIREATIEFIYAFATWEEEYTRYTSPRIFGCKDYIDEILIKNKRILNLSIVKSILNFNLVSGNILLLPMRSKVEEGLIVDVDSATYEEIRKYASPDNESMAKAYQTLSTVIPDSLSQKVMDLETFINRPWIPPVNRNDALDRNSPLISELSENSVRKQYAASHSTVTSEKFLSKSGSTSKFPSISRENKKIRLNTRDLMRRKDTNLSTSSKMTSETRNSTGSPTKYSTVILSKLDDSSLSSDTYHSSIGEQSYSNILPVIPLSTNSLREWYFRDANGKEPYT